MNLLTVLGILLFSISLSFGEQCYASIKSVVDITNSQKSLNTNDFGQFQGILLSSNPVYNLSQIESILKLNLTLNSTSKSIDISGGGGRQFFTTLAYQNSSCWKSFYYFKNGYVNETAKMLEIRFTNDSIFHYFYVNIDYFIPQTNCSKEPIFGTSFFIIEYKSVKEDPLNPSLLVVTVGLTNLVPMIPQNAGIISIRLRDLTAWSMTRSLNLISISVIEISSVCVKSSIKETEFAYKKDGRLYIGDNPIKKFVGMNANLSPVLSYLEIDDLVLAAAAISGFSQDPSVINVIAMEALVSNLGNLEPWYRESPYILTETPRVYQESALKKLDYIFWMLKKNNLRVVVNLFDTISYINQFCISRGVYHIENCMFKEEIVITDIEYFISTIMDRVNTFTGIKYKNDPTVLAFNMGEGLLQFNQDCPPLGFVKRLASHLRYSAPNHLIAYTCGNDWNGRYVTIPEYNISDIDIFVRSVWSGSPYNSDNGIQSFHEIASAFKKVSLVTSFNVNMRKWSSLVTATEIMTQVPSFYGIFISRLYGRKQSDDGSFYYGYNYEAGFQFPGFSSKEVNGSPNDARQYLRIIHALSSALKAGKTFNKSNIMSSYNKPIPVKMDYPPILLEKSYDSETGNVLFRWFGVAGSVSYNLFRALGEDPNSLHYTKISSVTEFQGNEISEWVRGILTKTCETAGLHYRLVAVDETGLTFSPPLTISFNKTDIEKLLTTNCKTTSLPLASTPTSSLAKTYSNGVEASGIVYLSLSSIFMVISIILWAYQNRLDARRQGSRRYSQKHRQFDK